MAQRSLPGVLPPAQAAILEAAEELLGLRRKRAALNEKCRDAEVGLVEKMNAAKVSRLSHGGIEIEFDTREKVRVSEAKE